MEIQTFVFEKAEVRTVIKNNEPYFVGKDIATILGFKNSRDAISTHVFEEDKGVDSIDTLGGVQKMTIVNESGLYALVFGSRLPKAKEFKRWVTSEVLPTIRKHGAYMNSETIEKALTDPDTIIQLATTLKEEREEKEKLEVENKQLRPKADYFDKYIANKGVMTIGVIAENYGMSARQMNDLLHELGVQYKQSNTWRLYIKHKDKGYAHMAGFDYMDSEGNLQVKPHLKWHPKGHHFIYGLLKEEGILPMIERNEVNELG